MAPEKEKAPRVTMDDDQRRTMFIGLAIAFAIYGSALLVQRLLPPAIGVWASLGLIAGSLAFSIGWFIAVRRGFRLGVRSKVERRAKEKQRAEREKLRKLRR